MSIIGLVIGAIVWLTCFACASAVTKGIEQGLKDPNFQKQMQDATKDLDKALKELNKK